MWRRLAAIQMRSNPGLVRLAKALGWPHHQVEERQAKVQREELLDGNMQLLEESDGGRDGDLLDLQQRTDLENRVKGEADEDLLSLPDQEMDNQSKERKEETWKKVLYMISNYPGPNSIHSPVKVANPS